MAWPPLIQAPSVDRCRYTRYRDDRLVEVTEARERVAISSSASA